MSITAKLRVVFALLLVGATVAGLVGWFMGKDPAQLGPVIAWIVGAVAAGEASNVGKRATYNADA